MAVERAGQPAQPGDLVDVPHLVTAYYTTWPDVADPAQRVAFGTSGHRGSSLTGAFTEAHIVATTQAIVDYRREQGIAGPLFMGRDTHGALRARLGLRPGGAGRERRRGAASTAATGTRRRRGLARDPAHNRGKADDDGSRADGIVVTPSHNPPTDGGFKYNPPDGGPAGTDITSWIAERANAHLADALRDVRRVPLARAAAAATTGGTTSSASTSATCPRSSTSTPSARPACASGRTRSAGPASPTGARSPTATGSTSPWSTRWSTRPGAS